jgi:hypothetical protein
MHNADGWGRIRPGVEDLHPGHEKSKTSIGRRTGRRGIVDLKIS